MSLFRSLIALCGLSFGLLAASAAVSAPGPVRGQNVTIELTDEAQGGPAAEATEVANQKIVDTGAARLGRQVISIVEAELYSRVESP